MSLKQHEIIVGAVAYFSTTTLKNLGLLQEADLENNLGMRPYVCLAASNGKSEWYAITHQSAPKRQKIYKSWRSGGSHDWRQKDQYINDLRQGLVAEDSFFIQASASELDFRNGRPMVSPSGIPAIIKGMEEVGGSLAV